MAEKRFGPQRHDIIFGNIDFAVMVKMLQHAPGGVVKLFVCGGKGMDGRLVYQPVMLVQGVPGAKITVVVVGMVMVGQIGQATWSRFLVLHDQAAIPFQNQRNMLGKGGFEFLEDVAFRINKITIRDAVGHFCMLSVRKVRFAVVLVVFWSRHIARFRLDCVGMSGTVVR